MSDSELELGPKRQTVYPALLELQGQPLVGAWWPWWRASAG
ncbi:hypothetical protein OG871_36665 [Kitasatospora sp. NBC_00374]